MCEEKANTIKEESIAIGNLQKPHFFITQIFLRLLKRVSEEKKILLKKNPLQLETSKNMTIQVIVIYKKSFNKQILNRSCIMKNLYMVMIFIIVNSSSIEITIICINNLSIY